MLSEFCLYRESCKKVCTNTLVSHWVSDLACPQDTEQRSLRILTVGKMPLLLPSNDPKSNSQNKSPRYYLMTLYTWLYVIHNVCFKDLLSTQERTKFLLPHSCHTVPGHIYLQTPRTSPSLQWHSSHTGAPSHETALSEKWSPSAHRTPLTPF